MARVSIIATGGTIQNSERGRLPLAQVLAEITAGADASPLPGGVELSTVELLNAGAETFGLAEWRAIAAAVEEAVERPDVDGVVVTHGTFTAEETAYLLHLVIGSRKPVVLAVAQRRHGATGGDGDRNLIDAIRVAADGEAMDKGVLLVVSDEIHSARDVTKESQRLGGFRSSHGPLGGIESDRVTFYRQPVRRHTGASMFRLASLAAMPRVDIVAAYPGADAAAIDAFLAAGAAGLVTAGYAYSGVASPMQMAALQRAVDGGVAVVFASRGRDGRIPDAGRQWTIRADNLSPQKARILLGLGLAHTRDRAALQELFDMY